MKLIPKPNPKEVPPQPWQGLTDLRVSLISQSRFMEAVRFSPTEKSAGTATDDYETTRFFLRLTMDHRAQVANTRDEIPWRIAMVGCKLDLGKLFASLGAKEQAEIWFNNLEKELEESISLVTGSEGTLKASDSLDVLTLEFYRLKIVEKDEPMQSRFQQLLSLGEKMQAASHIETGSAHYLAIAWAKKLYPPEQFAVLQTDIQLRTQKFFQTQGRAGLELANMIDIMVPSANSYSELARRIEMLQDFERKHPHLSSPNLKQMLLGMLLRLRVQAGKREFIHDAGALIAEYNAIAPSMPSGDNIKREVSIVEPSEQALEVKDILDRQETETRDFNLDYTFVSRPEQVVVPILLQKFVSKDTASGSLTEQALLQLFGSSVNDIHFKTEDILKLNGQELLENLVGNADFPLYGKEWAHRRPALRSWLLDDSSTDYSLRQCLWVALHNSRCRAWNSHSMKSVKGQGYFKIQRPILVQADCTGKFVKTIAPDWFEATCEHIQVIQERLDLKEAKLGSTTTNDHFENEWWIVRSMLSQFYINLFLCCRIPGEKLSDETIEFYNRAEEIARDQITHWRSVQDSHFFAKEAIYLATIAQLRIEHSIIQDPEEIGKLVDDTLALLEEVELLFGTTLYDVDLGRTLDFINLKSHMGSGMGIWRIGKLAIRLLHLAISMVGDKVQSGGNAKTTTRQQQWLQQLWQWVQRVKARTLAQSMGLDNVVPDNMLVEIQKSLNDERASAERDLTTSAYQAGAPGFAALENRLAAIKLEKECAPPLELLSQVRQVLKDSSKVSFNIASDTIDRSFIQDLQRLSKISEQLRQPEASDIRDEASLKKELSQIKERMATKPSLQKLLTIADFLNREEVLRNKIETASDRFPHRIKLQRLRQEMRCEPALERMLRIREGRPISDQDLHKIAATRQGKVVFVDWFTITSIVGHVSKVYMLLWRNGVCKRIDLETEHSSQRAAVEKFFDVKDMYLPDVLPTPLGEMNLHEMAPAAEKEFDDGELKPVLNCFELVQPLFKDPLVEAGDLLVLSLTEGFHNFPLHAIQEDEDDETGPLILNHPIVYVPSLSVLHKCYWSRHVPGWAQSSKEDNNLRSLVLGGIVSPDPGFQYGVKAVPQIGGILKASKTTFVGDDATLNNLDTHISTSDVLHIHLHTNYGDKKSTKDSGHGHLGQGDVEDIAFVNSPLDQAIVFNGSNSNNKLTAARIIELKLAKGAHFNLMACASGRLGTHKVESHKMEQAQNVITDEVMGLVPALLFSGAGSVTSALWPIMDEHGAVFSNFFFRAFVEAREKVRSQRTSGDEEVSWIDLAEIHQKAVLEMRRIYKQPSAWAGFVLSGCWKFQV
jgi:CHAT domain-containing protein